VVTKLSGNIDLGQRDVHAQGQGEISRSQKSWHYLTKFAP